MAITLGLKRCMLPRTHVARGRKFGPLDSRWQVSGLDRMGFVEKREEETPKVPSRDENLHSRMGPSAAPSRAERRMTMCFRKKSQIFLPLREVWD
jgi:hypothetical protein